MNCKNCGISDRATRINDNQLCDKCQQSNDITNTIISGAIGYATDNAILGGLIGGDLLGGLIGDMLNDGDIF